MSTSMVSTVLEIEREAENILKKAEQDAEKVVADARSKREADARDADDRAKKAIAAMEAEAASDREIKVKELAATGEAALSAVRNISDAAFDNGVKHILDALAGKK